MKRLDFFKNILTVDSLKNNFKTFCKKNLHLKISIIIVSLMFFVSFAFFSPTYEEVDDVSMMRMASGQYMDPPSPLLVHINPLYGEVLSRLYMINDSVSWYGLFFYILIFISYTIILSVIFARSAIQNSVLLSFFIFPLLLYSIIFLQYTAVSSYVVFAGVLLACWNATREKNFSVILQVFAIFLVFVGGLIRKESFIYVFAVSFPVVVYSLFSNTNKSSKKWLLFFISASLILFVSGNLIGNQKYNQDPNWIEYMDWHKIRFLFHDYMMLDYNKNLNIYQKFGWSINDYKIFTHYFYFDKNIYDTKILSEIFRKSFLESISSSGMKFTSSLVLSTIKYHSLIIISLIYLIGVAYFTNKTNKSRRVYIFSILTISILIIITFCFLGKVFPPRLMYPFLVISTISIFYLLTKEGIQKFAYSAKILFVIYLIVCINTLLVFINFASYNKEKVKNFKEMLKIFPKDTLVINWASSIPIHWLSPLEAKTFENIDLMGTGWPIRSPYEDKYLKKYNINNVYLDIIDNKNVYLVATPEYIKMYQQFLKEHYDTEIKTHEIANLEKYEVHPRYSYGAKVYSILSEPE